MASGLVERSLDRVGRLFLPLLPWLFLALRQALIATLVAVAVAALFFVVPQSREVLHGLTEAPLKSLREYNEASSVLINLWGYVFYVCTAVGLGLATWYSARLLCTVEAGIATPNALETGDEFTRLQYATTWLPRGLGVFVLGAAVGALIFAGYTPGLADPAALALAATAIAGPLAVVIGRFAAVRGVQWLGIVVTIGAVVALALCAGPGRWRVVVASTIASVLPALLLWFLERRRTLLQKLGQARQEASDQRTFGETIVALFAIVLVSTGLLLLLAFLPTGPVRAYGSAAAVLLFLAAVGLLLSGIQVLMRRIARNVPGFTAFAIVVLAVTVAAIGEESLGTERLIVAAGPVAAPPQPAGLPAQAAAPSRPLYVNAHGGGLRAAAFTAQVLAAADDASCGRFGEQVAAYSGVSGGSLGIATYLVARQEFVARGGWKSCTPGVSQQAMPLTDRVITALFQDHLSPTVARMLSVDAPHLPWSPARGQALLESWQSALVESLTEMRDAKDREKPAAFAQRLGNLTGGLRHPPAVFFNATDADTGHIVSYTNTKGGRVHFFPSRLQSVPDITVGQAVLHSARFPIVSPAGKIELQEQAEGGKVKVHRLVDGGYADNSGTTTLQRILSEKLHGELTPRLVNIDGNPPEVPDCAESGDKPAVLTAVGGLLQARTAHAALAVDEFKRAVSSQALDVVFDLGDTITDRDTKARCEKLRRLHHAPLGWYISHNAARNMGASVQVSKQQLCAALGETCTAKAAAKK